MTYMRRLLIFCLSVIINSSYALSAYTNNELDELEKEFIQQINLSNEIERNPLAIQYINQVGKKLAAAAHLPTPYFFIVKSLEINAFAGPGGYIGINTQLILATENESELAAVMAHELAHVRLHHLYRMIEHQKQMRIPMLASLLASAALGLVNPALANGALMATMGGFAQDSINFTRANEKEADRIGIRMLIGAGFNPQGMASFFGKMQQSMRYYYTANIPAILRTHPLDEDRIAEAENRTANLAKQNVPSSTDYYLFKELIRSSVVAQPNQLLPYYKAECLRHSPQYACEYGYAMVLMRMRASNQAEAILNNLANNDKNNLFYQIALSEAQINEHKFGDSLERLQSLHASLPNNYAALMAYAHGLLAANDNTKASSVLLKGSRLFKRDLPLCDELARAQSASNQKAYAYFTESQCQLLQGRNREAMRQLRLAKKLAQKDAYLSARINAMMDEVKFIESK